MGHDHDHEDDGYFENFDSYYVGWTILILILLALLVCMGYVYVKAHNHAGAYTGDYSMSPGGGDYSMSPGGGKWYW